MEVENSELRKTMEEGWAIELGEDKQDEDEEQKTPRKFKFVEMFIDPKTGEVIFGHWEPPSRKGK